MKVSLAVVVVVFLTFMAHHCCMNRGNTAPPPPVLLICVVASISLALSETLVITVSLYLMQTKKKLPSNREWELKDQKMWWCMAWITIICCLLILVNWHRIENPVHQTSVYRSCFFCFLGHFAVIHNSERLVQTCHSGATINAIVAQVEDIVWIQTRLLDVSAVSNTVFAVSLSGEKKVCLVSSYSWYNLWRGNEPNQDSVSFYPIVLEKRGFSQV